MEHNMFCYQCEQTAGKGCAGKVGACGKTAATAGIQDDITGALIGLAKTAADKGRETEIEVLLTESLFATLTNVNFDDETLQKLLRQIRGKKAALSAEDCRLCGDPYEEYRLSLLWQTDEDIRALKSLLLFGIRGMAAYAYHAARLGRRDAEIPRFLCKALKAIAEDHTMEELLELNLELGKVNLTAMALLDDGNHATYGVPEPQTIELTIEPGPFIIITGHDLSDLEQLLIQTEGKGVNVYTHGEMLPAHSYPHLKKYRHLKGNFGTAWQNQREEFDGVPAPILFTTNCLTPQKPSYSQNIFTT
ncbi:MAG: hydroxylamine reductase, partial [Clostridia bacterium]